MESGEVERLKYLIIGGGPAGLSFANRLLANGETSFLLLEAENEAGGLCRSCDVDGAPFDIGGGHFLDVKRARVNEFLFGFLPESEWNLFERDSRIIVGENEINHPIEANIWQFELEDQIEYLKSIAMAGCNTGEETPSQFTEWIHWKLGKKIADDYMIPYNKKMFGEELSHLGTYWLEKLPNVSFEETLRSCLARKAYGTQPGHARFYYPKKHGYGELWNRMAHSLKDKIEYNKHVIGIDFTKKIVMTKEGDSYQGDCIITTIPWHEYKTLDGLPNKLVDGINKLKHTSIVTRYYSKKLDTKAQWIYYPNPKLSYHRILVRSNFCPNSRGYWTETNVERDNLTESVGEFNYTNKYAYPLNTVDKPLIMRDLLTWTREQGVIGLGRWGEHNHYNSDVTVELAMKLADECVNGLYPN